MLPIRFFISSVSARIFTTRTFHKNFESPRKTKYKWEENPPAIEAPANGGIWGVGNLDDEEYNPKEDEQIGMHPEEGDKIYPDVVYREPGPAKYEFYEDRLMGKIFAGLFWFWVFYHLYWDYGRLTGHFYLPYLHEFSDEELGISPDDADDPTPDQYWGHHGKPLYTYR